MSSIGLADTASPMCRTSGGGHGRVYRSGRWVTLTALSTGGCFPALAPRLTMMEPLSATLTVKVRWSAVSEPPAATGS